MGSFPHTSIEDLVLNKSGMPYFGMPDVFSDP